MTVGDIDLQYKGSSGAIIAEMASVDQDGAFVSPVPLTCRGNRALHMSFWRTDGDWHSSVTLQNVAATDNEVEVTISYPGGNYVLNERLGPAETRMISINELQQSQIPDEAGRVIPLNARLGGVNIWSTNLNDGLVLNAMLMNPVTKTCGSCNGTGYVALKYLIDVADVGATSMKAHCAGDTFTLAMNMYWSTSTYSLDYSINNVQTSDVSVAAPNGGSITCGLPGTASLTGTSGQYYPTDPACSSYTPQTAHATALVIKIDNVTASGATKVTKTIGNMKILHFVTPKGGSGSKVTLTASITPNTTAAKNSLSWEGATVNPSNRLEATVPKTAASKAVVKLKIGSEVCKEMRVWTVWATTESVLAQVQVTSPITVEGSPGIIIRGGIPSRITFSRCRW